MTHYEWTKTHKQAVPCASWHITFGGRCLNCGYDPNPKTIEAIEAELARQEKRREDREEVARLLKESSAYSASMHYIDGMIDGLRYARNVVNDAAKGEKV